MNGRRALTEPERDKFLLEKLNYLQVKQKVAEGYAIFIPVGSTEQHGKHMPLGTDSMCVREVAIRTASKMKALVAPVVSYGVSSQHMNFSGTVTVEPETLVRLIVEIATSLAHHGFKKIILFNGHGGNVPSLTIATRKIAEKTEGFVAVASYFHAVLCSQPIPKDRNLAKFLGRDLTGHGGLIECSIVMAIDRKLIDLSSAEMGCIDQVLQIEDDVLSLPYMIEEKSPTGTFGDLTDATPEMGEFFIEVAANTLAQRLRKSYVIAKKRRLLR